MNALRLRPLPFDNSDVLHFNLYSWYQSARLISPGLPKMTLQASELRPILGCPFEPVKRVAKTVIDCRPYASGWDRPLVL